MKKLEIKEVLVNTHYMAKQVQDYLARTRFVDWVRASYEADLLGTAGTIREHAEFIGDSDLLLVHADNYCICNFEEFVKSHYALDNDSAITMMTFATETPESCGIVELDSKGYVTKMHEKIKNPPNNLANGAVYILDNVVVKWLKENPEISDFSLDVIPEFYGQIRTWQNEGTHIDIGNTVSLLKAQQVPKPHLFWDGATADNWQKEYDENQIHSAISSFV